MKNVRDAVIYMIIISMACIPLAGCSQPIWQEETVMLSEQLSESFTLSLEEGQILNVQFVLNSEDVTATALIGPATEVCHCDYCLISYEYKEYADIKNGSEIEFEAPESYPYSIWIKSDLVHPVEMTLRYWVDG